ncbi:MAG TPA: hypothetical protein VFT55_17515 [Planctomycetota bacterium]|nr:hypothetical protein [Planctomycetota bacterium]
MQRSLVLALIVALAVLVGAVWMLTRGDALPPPPPATTTSTVSGAVESQASGVAATVSNANTGATHRESVKAKAASVLDDPEIQAGLTGFKGRVVDHQKTAVADCGVRLYRGALDSVLPDGFDLFADAPTYEPQYIAGETRSGTDGAFLITGVWPRALYVLHAGIGTDAPAWQLVTRLPSPGEIVDLGDVVLPDACVITGTVLGEDGEPLPGALVRAADLPGTVAAFFPVERFDPEGAVLIREANSPVRVVEMPKWVKGAFENLPIPSAFTDGAGRFRLVGVTPGSNMLATTMRGYLSDVKPSIQARAGQEKDVGSIKMKRGEELSGKVLDTAGKPVAAAEVLAGSTLSMAPVDLAQKVGVTDAEGRFQAQGFAPGKVTVAARRGAGHPWFLAEPQPVFGEVVVTLPATFGVNVAVTIADGAPVAEPRFRLLPGRAGDGAAEMHLMGFVPPVDLSDRLKPVAEGKWRIEHLNPGPYTLVADAPGCAVSFASFEITTGDVNTALQLHPPKVFTVRVLDHEDKPIRNATIFAEARGTRVVEMPIKCGRTDTDGVLVIDRLQADSLRVSADHPRWGVAHGEVKVNAELVLHMLQPGALRGTLTENGKPPSPGRFSIALMRQRGNDSRGPLEQVPGLLTPGLDGSFAVAALQPGSFQITAIKSLDTLRSPGGVFALAQDMWLMRDRPDQRFEITSGQTTEVQLDAGEKPIEGPTGTISGSVMVDGRLGTGTFVTAWANQRRYSAKVDGRGRFELGTIPAGDVWFSVNNSSESGVFFGSGGNLYAVSMKLAEAEAKEVAIDVTTSAMSGVCYLPGGLPAVGVHIQAQGKLKGVEQSGLWLSTVTDAEGAFTFKQVAAGTWSLNANARGKESARGRLDGIEVNGGVPVEGLRLELHPSIVVKGRVDLQVFAQKKPQWLWIGFYKVPANAPANAVGDYVDSAGLNQKSGEFTSDDLTPGSYRVRLHAQFGDDEKSVEYLCQDITVPATGLEGVVLHPTPRIR